MRIFYAETFVTNLKSRDNRVLYIYIDSSLWVNVHGLIDSVDDTVLGKVSIPFSMVKGYTQTHIHMNRKVNVPNVPRHMCTDVHIFMRLVIAAKERAKE